MKRLLSPDPAEGSLTSEDDLPLAAPLTADQAPPGESPELSEAPPPAPTPPPAAETVLKGRKTERELRLEKTLKERETRLAELEDENRLLKTPRIPEPATPARRAKEKDSWLSGATFFEE